MRLKCHILEEEIYWIIHISYTRKYTCDTIFRKPGNVMDIWYVMLYRKCKWNFIFRVVQEIVFDRLLYPVYRKCSRNVHISYFLKSTGHPECRIHFLYQEIPHFSQWSWSCCKWVLLETQKLWKPSRSCCLTSDRTSPSLDKLDPRYVNVTNHFPHYYFFSV